MVGVGAKKAPEAAHLQAIESLPFHFRLVPQSTDCREYFKKRGAAAGLSGQVRGQKRGSAGPAVAPKVALRVAACQPLLALRACLVNPCRGGLNRLGFSESKPMPSLVFS